MLLDTSQTYLNFLKKGETPVVNTTEQRIKPSLWPWALWTTLGIPLTVIGIVGIIGMIVLAFVIAIRGTFIQIDISTVAVSVVWSFVHSRPICK